MAKDYPYRGYCLWAFREKDGPGITHRAESIDVPDGLEVVGYCNKGYFKNRSDAVRLMELRKGEFQQIRLYGLTDSSDRREFGLTMDDNGAIIDWIGVVTNASDY